MGGAGIDTHILILSWSGASYVRLRLIVRGALCSWSVFAELSTHWEVVSCTEADQWDTRLKAEGGLEKLNSI